MNLAEQAAARLAELTGATPAELRSAMNEFDVRDIAAALGTGGGNGGSQPLAVYADTITYAEMLANAPDHTKTFRTLAEGSVLLGWGIVITEAFDSTDAADGFFVDDGNGNNLWVATGGAGTAGHIFLDASDDFGPYLAGHSLALPAASTSPGILPLIPVGAPLDLVFNLASFATDGMTGAVVVYSTIWTPS